MWGMIKKDFGESKGGWVTTVGEISINTSQPRRRAGWEPSLEALSVPIYSVKEKWAKTSKSPCFLPEHADKTAPKAPKHAPKWLNRARRTPIVRE